MISQISHDFPWISHDKTRCGQVVDHASQFVTCLDPEFSEVLASSGAARRFGTDGRFGRLSTEGFSAIDDQLERWVGIQGMAGIVKALAQGLEVHQDRKEKRWEKMMEMMMEMMMDMIW